MPIFIIDAAEHNLNAEQSAKLQALYSRNPASVMSHINDITSEDVSTWMEKWYVGYGHDSIGQMGTTTAHFEGVSMIAAKYIQNNDYYNGQELSSRYADMNEQGTLIPVDILCGRHPTDLNTKDVIVKDDSLVHIVAKWMQIYNKVFSTMRQHYEDTLVKPDSVGEKKWANTLDAKAFDVARGFLPAGTRTNVSWHAVLNNIHRNLPRMLYTTLPEIRDIGKDLLAASQAQYPGSFREFTVEEALWNTHIYAEPYSRNCHRGLSVNIRGLDIIVINRHRHILENRPKYMPLPETLREAGRVTTKFTIDFGGFRDLQRHRSGDFDMPIVAASNGYHSWYLNELTDSLREEVLPQVQKLYARLEELTTNDNIQQMQYCCPLMTIVHATAHWRLQGFVYTTELRSSPLVHETVRQTVQLLSEAFQAQFKSDYGWQPVSYVNHTKPKIDARRGDATIERKD